MTSSHRRRKRFLGILVALIGVLVIIGASTVAYSEAVMPTITKTLAIKQIPVNVPSLTNVTRVPVEWIAPKPAAQVPVLVYHALNDGCAPTSMPICKSNDYETISTAQFLAQMNWLYSQGYHTVTIDQYVAWLNNGKTLLPSKPILLTDDNGDSDFLLGAEPILYHYRFTLAADLDTGFNATATTGFCLPKRIVAGKKYDVQPGCSGPNTWNVTWPQLAKLSPQVYSYIIEAGPAGHYEQTYNKKCTAYYACLLPGETTTQYQQRVSDDMMGGMDALQRYLPGRANLDVWVVPYSDLGYPCGSNGECANESHTVQNDWLIRFGQANFKAVFVQDAYRNGIDNERFRYEIQNTTTTQKFIQHIGMYLKAGDWRR